jgi:hypothetical protein
VTRRSLFVTYFTSSSSSTYKEGDDDQPMMDLGAMPEAHKEVEAPGKKEFSKTRAIPYHYNYELHVMLIPLCTLFAAW